jgi:2-octaprenyl-6-methoxyphenol hydroxylase
MNAKETLIVGGGPTGCLLALALHERGVASRVLDARQPGQAVPDRTLALSWFTVQQLLAYSVIDPSMLTPIRRIQVGKTHPWGGITFDAADIGLEALGYTLSYAALHAALMVAVQARSIPLHEGIRVNDIQRSASWAFAVTETGDYWSSKALVVAEGGKLKPQGWDYDVYDYEQYAWIAFLPGVEGQGVAYERFTDRGILAFLPDQHGTTLIFSLRKSAYEAWRRCSREEQNRWLRENSPASLIGSDEWVERAVVPLAFQALRSRVSPPLWVCGNAAQVMHPVAALGFNLGVRDVLDTASSLHNFFYPTLSSASPQSLGWGREWDRRWIQTVSDRLARLGHLEDPMHLSAYLFEGIKRIGMKALDITPFSKTIVLETLIWGL